MKLRFLVCLAVLAVAVWGRAQTNVISYQGQLNVNGVAANGDYDLRFTLHDTPAQTNQVAGPVVVGPTTVSGGVFSVMLNFGSTAFSGGSNRWLQIGVRGYGETNAYTVLTPRQLLTPAPYALRAVNAGTAETADFASVLNSAMPATNLSGTIPDARLSTNVALLNTNVVFSGNVTAARFNGSGAGLTSVPAVSLTGAIPDQKLSTNVAFLNSSPTFAGTVTAPLFNGNGTGLTNVPGRIFETIPTGAPIQAAANTGYLATNDSTAVVVTLPQSMRVGETVRVSGSGAAGWIVAQNAGQKILVAGLLDTVGLSWTTNGNALLWSDIASSADGTRLVAVVNYGGQIYVSTNSGVTWMPRESNRYWRSVASSADGTKLVAAVNPGQIFTSGNSGSSWTGHGGNLNWTSVASSVDGNHLVAAAQFNYVYTSPDSGQTWTPRLTDTTRNWSAVASSGNGSNLVAAVQGGQIYTSPNGGAGWVARDSNRSWVSLASSTDGSHLVAAVNSGQLYVSDNFGATWTATGISAQWSAVASSGDGSRLAAVINTGGLFVSTDSGATWVQRFSLPSVGWTGVTFSEDGGTLAAVAGSTRIYVSSQTSTTIGAAGYVSGTRLSSVELQYIGNDTFMPITSMGRIRFY